jgi:antitoxin component of MazEF toxin-antitoxin module
MPHIPTSSQPLLVKLVPIGNSLGVRIPRFLLGEFGAGADVEVTVEKGRIILKMVVKKKSEKKVREGWKELFVGGSKKEKESKSVVKKGSEVAVAAASAKSNEDWVW